MASYKYRWLVLFLAVTSAYAAVGFVFSTPAVGMWDFAYPVRGLEYLIVVTSTLGGLGAGVLWCLSMRMTVGPRGAGLDKSLTWGTVLGIAAGAFGASGATFLHTHVALIGRVLATPPHGAPPNWWRFQAPEMVVITLGRAAVWLCHGVRAGGIIGLLGGGILWLVLGRSKQSPCVSAKAP